MFVLFNSTLNHIGGVMISMFASSAVDCGFECQSGQINDYKIGICCFASKNDDLMLQNQNNMPQWSYMSPRGVMLQWIKTPTKRAGLVQSGHHCHHMIERSLFSPWYHIKQQSLIYYIHCKNIINDINWNTVKPVFRGHLWDKEQMVSQYKWSLKRGSIHMKCSMIGKEKGDCLINVTPSAGLTVTVVIGKLTLTSIRKCWCWRFRTVVNNNIIISMNIIFNYFINRLF